MAAVAFGAEAAHWTTPGSTAAARLAGAIGAGRAPAVPVSLRGPCFALVGARLLDGIGGDPLEGMTIAVEHGRIVAVGVDGATPLPRSVGRREVMDVAGATLTPGLIDAHVHLAFARDPTALARGGVTAARDLGWPRGRLAPLISDAWRAGTLVTWAGRMLTAPGGYPTNAGWAPIGTAREVRGIDDAVRAVDEQMRGGAGTIKVALDDRVGPILSSEVLDAIVERADEWGRDVTAHVGSEVAFDLAMRCRVAELAHVPFASAAITKQAIEAAATDGVVVVPTLRCREHTSGREAEAIAFLRAFVAAGGAVAYGTDLGNAHTTPGADGRELALMCAAGITPGDVVVAATSGAAARLGGGVEHLVGRIEPGRRADVLVLQPGDDPLVDVSALTRPAVVIAGGVVRATRLGPRRSAPLIRVPQLRRRRGRPT